MTNKEAISVLQAIKENPSMSVYLPDEYEALDLAIKALERPKSKWKDYLNEGFVECPFCGSATNCVGDKDELHYCFSCGAELT